MYFCCLCIKEVKSLSKAVVMTLTTTLRQTQSSMGRKHERSEEKNFTHRETLT